MNKWDQDDDLLIAGMQLDDRPGPARRISREHALAMVQSALASWQSELPVTPHRRSLLPVLALAASLVLAVVGGASAARWYFGKAQHAPELATQRPAAAPANRHAHTTTLPEVTQLPAPELPAPHAAARGNKIAPVQERAEPDDLLQRANRLRAEGSFESAADTYAQVYERYPRTLSAYAAEVAAGSIALEHLGQPEQARTLFESALHSHPRGALDLEARQGLSLSLRDLGRERDEASSLLVLIRDHGESPAARRAEARLKELSSAP